MVKFFVCLKVLINRGMSSEIIVFILFFIGFLVKLILCDVCVFIILFVLFINVGIKWREIDIINVILWIGIFICFNGFNNVFKLFVILIGVVVNVNNVVIKIIMKNCIEMYIFCFNFFLYIEN